MQYLIVPRYVGIIISSVILLALGLVIGIAGSMVVARVIAGINFLEFTTSIPRFNSGLTVVWGALKCVIYSAIVAGVACHRGYTASGGARGVGKAVTLAAVYTNFYIVIANFITSQFLNHFMLWLSAVTHGAIGS